MPFSMHFSITVALKLGLSRCQSWHYQ